MKTSTSTLLRLLRTIVGILFVIAIFLSSQAFKYYEKQTIPLPMKKGGVQNSYTQEELNSFLDSVLPTLNDDNKKGGIGGETPDAISSSTYLGKAATDYFGYSVSAAGDVNGDGFDDIIVGAFANDAGGSNTGRAYIFFGGVTQNNVADVTLTGAAAGDNFGQSVSAGGDVNGDGYDDVIVGARYNDGAATDAGAAYVYFGGAIMNNTPDMQLFGAAGGDAFGSSVSKAGDVNSDGYDDVIVGALYNDNIATDVGRAYIYYGGASPNTVADVILTGAAAQDFFGYSVSDCGDFNGDGYDDVIVGAIYNDAGGVSAGRSYVYYGASSMDNGADLLLTGVTAGELFGSSVSGAGDVNGDGYSDIIVGSPYNDQVGTDCGKAYVFYGGSVPNNSADVSLYGATAGDYFGSSVSSSGDVNGDGYSDVIIGAYQNDAGGNNAGRAYIYYGGSYINNTADVTLSGLTANDFFGFSVSDAGDVNGDGLSDVIVGAYNNDYVASNAGAAYVYTNSLSGKDIADEFFSGTATNENFGWSVSSAGDVNGDGYSDIIVGSPYNDGVATDAGRAFIYFGGSGIDNVADVTFSGGYANDNFGYSVSKAGDVNGDGYSDVIVGTPFNDSTGADAGRAYIFLGGSSMDNNPDLVLNGEAAGDNFGFSVSTAGDVNGDGYSDIIIGAYLNNNANGTDAGKAYIYYGGASLNSTVDIQLIGYAASDYFGNSVSTAGDMNGDGYSDVIIGALWNDAGGSNAGRAYIYFGGIIMNTTVDLVLTGEAAGDMFGKSVSSAGDVNGDGFSDVIIGADGNDASGLDAGRAYIYFGGSIPNTTADVVLTGGYSSDVFGRSVSSAGDVNGDGYNDVIVNSELYDGYAGTSSGRADIYFGGPTMDNISDISMEGVGASDYFGGSVSGAGDVNGDGLADVVCGAIYNDGAATNAGRAYLFLSSAPPVKPRLVSVSDVPNDQGGVVSLSFIRSHWDVNTLNRISEYLIERSNAPGAGGYSWIQIGTISPVNNVYYGFEAATPFDSASGVSAVQYYRVTAKTFNPAEYYRSNIVSGYSVDNLAPLYVRSFTASDNSGSNKLTWRRNTETDLKDYAIFRNSTDTINITTAIPYAYSTDSTYNDNTPLKGESYYFVSARDIHGNLSTPVSVLAPNIGVSLTMFIEGYFNGTSNTIADTIKAYICNTTAPYSTTDSCTAVLGTNGSATLKFFNTPTSSYYLVITHRNGLETWSKSGGEAMTRGSSQSYNFTTAITQSFGSNMVQKGTKWCIYSGDVNQDGQVSLDDLLAVDSDNQNFASGYLVTDVNGDGQVTLDDLLITDANNQNFVSVQKPGMLVKKINDINDK